MSLDRFPSPPTDERSVERNARRDRRAWGWAAAVGLIGLAASVTVWQGLLAREREVIAAEFKRGATQRVSGIERTFKRGLVVINSMAAYFSVSRGVEREEFHAFARPFLEEYPRRIHSLQWIPRVHAAERAAHERAAREDGFEDYEITQRAPGDRLVRAGERDRYYPVFYIEPYAGNERTLGFDTASDPVRRDALARALEIDALAASARITLLREAGALNGVLVVGPAYAKDTPRDTPEQRRDNLEGFVGVEFLIGHTIDGALERFPPISMNFFVYDDDAPAERRLLYARTPDEAPPAVPEVEPPPSGPLDIFYEGSFDLAGRRWLVYATPTVDYVARQRTWIPFGSLLAGLALSTLLSAYVYRLGAQAAHVERMVEQRTGQLRRSHAALLQQIAQREQMAGALRESEARVKALIDNSSAVIYIKDLEGRYVLVNRRFEELFGVSNEALRGQTDFEIFPREVAEAFQANDRRVASTGETIEAEEVAPRQDGLHTYISIKFPLFEEDGALYAVAGISTDITDRKRAEGFLREAKDAAEAANRAKSDFLANMSHEIRTPMNAIIGMTELVLDSEIAARQREYLSIVLESAEALMTVIDEILDFSKIEAGKLRLDAATFRLRESVEDAMKSFSLRAHRKGLELACHVAPDVPDALIGDAGRLRQVVVNLVGNAIKFTDAGEVVVDVACEGRGDGGALLRFAVSDTGIGIPADKLNDIFRAFEQVDASTTRRYGGTGLGLAISSRLVDAMGGRLWVESEVGRGSTFSFTARLRVDAAAPALPPPARLADLRGVPVLVVDDNETNRRILDEMLASWGMRPQTASTAHDALERLRRAAAAGTPFRLLLADAHMPGMDGFRLVERLRAAPELNGAVVMMLTSAHRSGDLARCDELGIARYLTKPLKQSELLEAIAAALGAAPAERIVREEERPTRVRPLQVLLAEDSLPNQTLVVGILEKWGHEVTIANNGREAVSLARSGSFDVILMDVQMPEMDGLEATAFIRAHEQQAGDHVPIIAMTAHALKGDRERCLASGMDGYIAKPVRAKEIYKALALVVDLAGGEPALPEEPAAAEREPLPAEEATAGDREPPSLDLSVALETVGGDRDLLLQVVDAFLMETPRLVEQAHEALEQADAPTLKRAAHTMKGSLRTLDVTDAANLAAELESAAKDGRLEEAAGLLTDLEAKLDRLEPQLAAFLAEGRILERSGR